MIDEIKIHQSKSGKFITSIYGLKDSDTISRVKNEIAKQKPSFKADRLEVRQEQRSKGLKDEQSVGQLKLKSGDKLFVKDLGMQIGWTTVFLVEYAGPLFIYAWLYQRPWIFYGEKAASLPISFCAKAAAICWSIHYAKRLFETKFIHRFSHGTMPIFSLFKNCSYYWGFALYVAYHVNHPLFTQPCLTQVYAGIAGFAICELGNLSIHVALRNLRPAGSKERKIPHPSGNPMTLLFHLVSCPNYTYEVGAWISFSIMTQCIPAFLFTFAGFYQMAVWARGKQKNYLNEFSKYPKSRKAIIPFIL